MAGGRARKRGLRGRPSRSKGWGRRSTTGFRARRCNDFGSHQDTKTRRYIKIRSCCACRSTVLPYLLEEKKGPSTSSGQTDVGGFFEIGRASCRERGCQYV